jgi:hypothetical protein
MNETPDGILIRPQLSEKLSFEESFQEMAALGVLGTEIEEFEGTLADGLENDEQNYSAS